jgi:hypothetical protein
VHQRNFLLDVQGSAEGLMWKLVVQKVGQMSVFHQMKTQLKVLVLTLAQQAMTI